MYNQPIHQEYPQGIRDALIGQLTRRQRFLQEVKAALTPVEILYKPKPVYTDEARRLHVEGEVLMEVTFSANGRLQDMHIVRGLGHGLDEAAQRAAAQIKFRPAKRDGQPLDSTAYVHIVFELAE